MKIYFTLLTSCLVYFNLLAQATQSFTETPLFVNGTDNYACYRIPAILTATNGDILAFAEGRRHGCNDFGNVDIVLKRSTDNGQTWKEQVIVVDNKDLQVGNPAPVLDVLDPAYPDGRLFLFYNTGTASEHETRKGKGVREVWYKTSTDHGLTWSKPTNITAYVHKVNQPNFNTNYQFKEDWRTHANTPGHAIQLKKGTKAGRLFIPANHSFGPPQKGFNDYRAYAFFSDDHGKNWAISDDINILSSNESIAVELSDGRVMQNIRQQNGEQKNRLVSISSDGGSSWDTTYFDPQLPAPVCQASILAYTTPNQQEVILFSNPASKERREKMTVKVSYDNGKTWIIERQIRAGESAYSDLVSLANGDIGLLYEHGNDGGIHYSQFNYAWLLGAQNNTNSQWVKKLTNPQLATGYSFQLSDPVLLYDNTLIKESISVTALLDYEGVRIHYTLDGSNPTEQSPLYTAPINIKESANLKVKAFHQEIQASQVVTVPFVKVNSAIKIKSASLENAPNEKYAGQGANTLIDLKKGTTNFKTPHWLGFDRADVALTLELTNKQPIHKITASVLSDVGAWIFPPSAIEVWTAKKAGKFQLIANKEYPKITKASPAELQYLPLAFKPQKSKFLKIVVKNAGPIPTWHDGKGTPAWLFIDELLIE